MVFVQHYFAEDHPWLNWGWTGVDIFFVLSGFLITGILFDTREAPHRFRVFYMRRALRIFPLYYGVLFLALLTTPIFHWYWNRGNLLNFVYLSNFARFPFLHTSLVRPNLATGLIDHVVALPFHFHHSPVLLIGHFWSLSVEEQFYLVWPFFVFAVRKRTQLRNLCLWSIPVVLTLRVACIFFIPFLYRQNEFLYRATFLRVDSLLIGAACALMLRGPEAFFLRRIAPPLFAGSLAAFLLWLALYRILVGHSFRPSATDPLLTTIGYTLIDLTAGLLVLLLLRLENPLARFLNLAPLRALGRISYGFYIFHDMFRIAIIIGLAKFTGVARIHHQDSVVAIIGFLLTLLLATLSYHFYEKPFLRLKRFFTTPPAASHT